MPMTTLSRRAWLRQAGATLAASALGLTTAPLAGRVWATSLAQPRLLVVFLRGGYDALSLLVPRRGLYAEVRPTIRIEGAQPVDADWGLHPVLEAPLRPLLTAGQLSFVPFAGCADDLSRSHFETQDTIELGQPLGARRDFRSGFMNRLAVALGAAAPIAFTDQLPLILHGDAPVANLSLRSAPPKPGHDRLQPAIAAMYRGHALQERVDAAYALRDEVAREMGQEGARSESMADEMAAASRQAIPASGFEAEAWRIGAAMRERHRLGFVDVGGWDTHVYQGGSRGALANRLGELGRGLAAYAQALGEAQWRQTVVVVLSEFGRTVRENGAKGTDHGHGSVYALLGGALAVRRLAGEQLPIEASTLFQNRDLPVLNDVRSLLGGLLARLFGLSPAALAGVFPAATPRDLGLI